MDQRKIGAFIAASRKRRKLTQAELAERLGVTDRSVSNWENGVCLPDASLYQALCGALGISLDELFCGELVCDKRDEAAAERKLLVLLERRLYDGASREIAFDEFHHALKRLSETALLLQRFGDREEAVAYLVSETGLPEEECASAYDMYRRMFRDEADG